MGEWLLHYLDEDADAEIGCVGQDPPSVPDGNRSILHRVERLDPTGPGTREIRGRGDGSSRRLAPPAAMTSADLNAAEDDVEGGGAEEAEGEPRRRGGHGGKPGEERGEVAATWKAG